MRDAAFDSDVDLSTLNTLGLPARAAHLVTVNSTDVLRKLVASGELRDKGPLLVLGGGSNLVLTQDWPGCVLHIDIRGREHLGLVEGAHLLRAGGGENWHEFVRWTLAQGWPGLENLSLIPGTVGAAPIQNIGAYGVELADRFDSLEAVSLDDGSVRRFTREACEFGYRDSVFKRHEAGRWVIVSVTFRLPESWAPVRTYAELSRELEARSVAEPSALDVSDAVIAIRRRKLPDPASLGNAGSFFKNPVVDEVSLRRLLGQHGDMPHHLLPGGGAKLAAGWLIERCGWKGRDLGPAGCYEHQALVLVNRGGASGGDIMRLAAAIQHDVQARFGIALEPEPRVI